MLAGILLITIVASIWSFLYFGRDRLRQYRDRLGLEKANLVYGNDYQKILDLILPTRESAFTKSEPVIWLYRKEDTELLLGANQKADVRIWLQPKTVLEDVHIVLDSVFNNSGHSNLKKDKLPKQQIELEGNFSKHFKLYCDEDQQVIALQIIAPDIMAYLLDNLLSTDIEVVDNQIAIIVRNGAKTLDKLKTSIEVAQRLDRLTKAVTKVTKL